MILIILETLLCSLRHSGPQGQQNIKIYKETKWFNSLNIVFFSFMSVFKDTCSLSSNGTINLWFVSWSMFSNLLLAVHNIPDLISS